MRPTDLKRCHIVMVCARYPPLIGGTEAHVAEVSRRLAGRGHRVTVLTTTLDRHRVGVDTECGVDVHRVGAYPRSSDLYVAPSLPGVLRRLGPDVVHVQGYHTAVAPMAMSSALRHGIPYVLSLHSGGHSSVVRRSLRPLQHRLMRPLVRRSGRVIAVSAFELDRLGPALRLDRVRTEVVENGVADVFAQVAVDRRANEPLIASIGRLEWFKGHHLVIRAMPGILERVSSARLLVVGDGSIESDLRRLAADCGVADRVEFRSIPYDHRAEMAAIMGRSHVVALLSNYESQGLVGNEALAAGARTVVKNGTALAELGGRPGVVIVDAVDADDADVLAAVFARQLDAGAIETRDDVVRWDDTTDRLESVYRSVLEEHR